MFGIRMNQIKTISSISRKLQLDKSKLDQLLAGQKAGVPEDELLKTLLVVPDGVDPKEFLKQKLTPKEVEVLNEILEKYTNGKGTNPLA